MQHPEHYESTPLLKNFAEAMARPLLEIGSFGSVVLVTGYGLVGEGLAPVPRAVVIAVGFGSGYLVLMSRKFREEDEQRAQQTKVETPERPSA